MSEEPPFTIESVKNELSIKRQTLLLDFSEGGLDPLVFTKANSNLTDSYVRLALEHFLVKFKDEIALFTVGGNGREEVYPGADLDITILVPSKWSDKVDGEFTESLEKFNQFLYRIHMAGAIGITTRTAEQCREEAEKDQTIWTNFLDRRFLWGYEERATDLNNIMNSLASSNKGYDFIKAKLEERKKRLEKMTGVEFALKPNVKKGPGGLRDLQTMGWIAKAAGFGEGKLDDLIQYGIITADEKREIRKAHEFMAAVRCHLNVIKGIDYTKVSQNNISSDEMSELASKFPEFKADEKYLEVENFLQAYIKHSRTVSFWTDVVSAAAVENRNVQKGILPEPVDNSKQFVLQSGKINFAESETPSPIEMLNIFGVAQEMGQDIHPFAIRTIRRNLSQFNDAMVDDPRTQAILKDVLAANQGVGNTLRQMQMSGMLQLLAPVFGEIEALAPFDPYHQLPVDENIFKALEAANAIENGSMEKVSVWLHGVGQSITAQSDDAESNRRVLHFALFLHDAAKGQTETGDEVEHPRLGGKLVRDLGERFGLTQEETDQAAWLVENHLLMAHTAFRGDLNDPTTLGKFMKEAQSRVRLDLLSVMTAADIMSNGKDRWGEKDNYYIGELHREAAEFLGEKSEISFGQILGINFKNFISSASELVSGDQEDQGEAAETLIKMSSDFNRQATRIEFVTPQPSRVLERITKILAKRDLDVQEASLDLSTAKDLRTTGIFTVQTAWGKPIDEWGMGVEAELKKALNSDDILEEALPTRASKVKTGGYRYRKNVLIENEEGAASTKIEIRTRDTEALLVSIAGIFNRHRLKLTSMRAANYGHKADSNNFVKAVLDTFYVQDEDTGQPIDREKFEDIRDDILVSLPD